MVAVRMEANRVVLCSIYSCKSSSLCRETKDSLAFVFLRASHEFMLTWPRVRVYSSIHTYKYLSLLFLFCLFSIIE